MSTVLPNKVTRLPPLGLISGSASFTQDGPGRRITSEGDWGLGLVPA